MGGGGGGPGGGGKQNCWKREKFTQHCSFAGCVYYVMVSALGAMMCNPRLALHSPTPVPSSYTQTKE